MKILMLGWELPPHNSGGLGVACYHMAKALAAEGATIDFVVPYKASYPGSEFMTIHAATSLAPPAQGVGSYDSVHFDSDTLEHTHSLRSVQAQYTSYVIEHHAKPGVASYNAIHAHDWLTLEAGMQLKQLTGAPLIAHVHATEFDRAGSQRGNPIVHDIEAAGLMMADRIIAVSQLTKTIIVREYGIPPEKIEVIHNALDASELPVGYDRSTYKYLEYLKQQDYTVVATVTRFTIQKGLRQLLQAAARASEKYDRLVFLLAGDGEQRDELLQLSAEYGIADKVFFTGFVRGKQWRDAYRVADIFVMSSASEPFGITALEAAHYDNALILTKQSGASEVLRNIYRYDFWDVDALADRLITLAQSPALQMTMKRELRTEYTELNWQGVAKRCLALYNQPYVRQLHV